MNDDEYTKKLQEALEKRKDRVEFLKHIAPKKIATLDDINVAETVGLFVVYEQLLEENLRLLLDTVHSYKSVATNGETTVIRNHDFSRLTLGNLLDELRKISLDKTTGFQKKEDLLEQLKKQLATFVKKRNDYIHHLLAQNLKLANFKIKLVEAILELWELVAESDKMRREVEHHYDYKGSLLLSIAGHIISNDATKKG